MKTFIPLGTYPSPYAYGEEVPVAAVFGGDLRHGTIGDSDAPDAEWHLGEYGAFDRNMVGAYWFILPRIEADRFLPGLWARYQKAIEGLEGRD